MSNVFMLALVGMDLWFPGHPARVYTDMEDETRSLLLDEFPMNVSVLSQSLRTPIYNFKQTQFQSLENYHIEGIPANENKYPWIASLVHSRSLDFPFLCTAACVSTAVFITSARCIASIKIAYTTVKYKKTRFRVKTFVLPSKASKQWFDDIGVVVTEPNPAFKANWSTILLTDVKRFPNKNNKFQWFENLKYETLPVQHKVVGYATEKRFYKIKTPQTVYRLVELPVVVGIHMCEKTLSRMLKNQYHVPCYYYCNLNLPEYSKTISKCKKFIGTEGGAVVNTKSGKLLGVATWTVTANEMPVGIAVANSEEFKKDLECAKRIQADKTINPAKGHFQKLCPN